MRKILWFLILFINFSTYLLAVEGGYSGKLTYLKGDTLKLHLSSTFSLFSVSIYRYADPPVLIQTINNVPGIQSSIPDSAYAKGCNWPVTFQMKIPDNWTSGVYYATYTTAIGRPRVYFFVREVNPGTYSKILIMLSTNTWNAYNPYGGKSLYDYNSSGGRSSKVSFLRPDESWYSGSINFRKDELHLILWLFRNNINVEYASQYNVYKEPNLLQNYDLVIISGHNEYWSYPERIQSENYIKNGGNMMILSGNTCWWQVRYEDDGNTVVCYKNRTSDPLNGVRDSLVTVNFFAPPVNNNENPFTGVSFRAGGFLNNNGNLTKAQGYGGFSIYNSHHWIYEGTNYTDGELLGYNESIAGNEVDGALFTYVNGIPKFTGTDRSPQNFIVLGATPAYQVESPAYTTNHHGFMGIFRYPGGGTVFNSSTINWNLGLSFINIGNNNSGFWGSDTNIYVQKITKTLITRLSSNNIPPDIISWSPFTLESKTIMNEALQLNRRNITITSAQSITFNVNAVDPFSGALNYLWEVNNLNQNVSTASFTKNFTSSDPANNIVKVTVTNSKGSISLSWNVGSDIPQTGELAFTSTPKTSVNAGAIYTDTLSVTNTWNDSLVFSISGAPWLSINSQGVVTGTAPSQGTFNVTALVSNQHNQTDSLSWTIDVIVTPPAVQLDITSTPKTSVEANTNYLDTLKVYNYWNDPLVFSISGASWLSINSQGVITGTAPSQGTFNVTARVSNQHNQSDSLTWTINVNINANTIISSFTGQSSVTYVDLFWTTSLEINNQGFDVEKLTGKTWKRLGFVQGVGNSTTNNNYTYRDNTIKKGEKSASYRLKQISINGQFKYTDPIVITIKTAAAQFSIQNYPNPFNPSTQINYSLPIESKVKITIYNSIGEMVFKADQGVLEAGDHNVTFSASDLASGIYFYTLEAAPSTGADVFRESKKMLLVK